MVRHLIEGVFGILLLVIGIGLLTPILAYYMYQFHRLCIEDHDMVKYRNKTLVYCMNGLAIVSFCTERVLIILSQIFHVFDDNGPAWLPFIAEYSFIFGFYTLFLIKTWLSFYEYEYHRKLADLAWTQHVNPNTSNRKKDKWFIKYKHRLGNVRFLIKVGFVMFICQISIEVVIDIVFSHHHEAVVDHIITLVYTMLVFVASLILFFKTKDFNDIYHIKKEIQYQTFILLIILFTDIVAVTYEIIYDANTEAVNHEMEWIITLVLGDIAWFSICLISTAYPLYLYKRNGSQYLIKRPPSCRSSGKNHYLKQLLDIFARKDGFKSFMLHLICEYSTENLLFLLELVQIKSTFESTNKDVFLTELSDATSDDNLIDELQRRETNLLQPNGKIFCRVVVPYHVAQSVILEQYADDLWNQMLCLYKKYIKWGSDHELNISYEARNGLQEVFEKDSSSMTQIDLFSVMDGAAIAILHLLFDSFYRFGQTDTYHQLMEKEAQSKEDTDHHTVRL